jgi:hypothetical protein
MAAPVPYDNQGFIAQTVDNILQIKWNTFLAMEHICYS